MTDIPSCRLAGLQRLESTRRVDAGFEGNPCFRSSEMSWWNYPSESCLRSSEARPFPDCDKIVTYNLYLLEKSLDSFRRDNNCKEISWDSHIPLTMRYLASPTAVTTTKSISARIPDLDHQRYPLVHMHYKHSLLVLEYLVICRISLKRCEDFR